jgi:hypothetical protein
MMLLKRYFSVKRYLSRSDVYKFGLRTKTELQLPDLTVAVRSNPHPKKTARIRITAAKVVGEYFSGREKTTRSDEHLPE